MFPEALHKAVKNHKHPLLFATVSGAHLYGFPSPDSDFDLRGCHILPITEFMGLDQPVETIESSYFEEGIELDLVTHDAKKYFLMVLQRNGYVLEQILSPLVISGGEHHNELKEIAQSSCITRNHSHHYLGFSSTQWRLFSSEAKPRVKPLLYVYRVLLTGIYLMRTGIVEANLLQLNEEFKLSYLPELIEQKLSGVEKQQIKTTDLVFHEAEYLRLRSILEEEVKQTKLPEKPSGRARLDDLLRRIRNAPV